jgi:hypothetical protein
MSLWNGKNNPVAIDPKRRTRDPRHNERTDFSMAVMRACRAAMLGGVGWREIERLRIWSWRVRIWEGRRRGEGRGKGGRVRKGWKGKDLGGGEREAGEREWGEREGGDREVRARRAGGGS